MYIQRRKVYADDEIDNGVDSTVGQDDVEVDPEATDLLFEAEDVAELVAEVTGQSVDVTVDDDAVTFAVGEDEYTVEAEGDEEMLEASTKILRNSRRVSASTQRRTTSRSAARSARRPGGRRVAASTKTRPVRRVGRR